MENEITRDLLDEIIENECGYSDLLEFCAKTVKGDLLDDASDEEIFNALTEELKEITESDDTECHEYLQEMGVNDFSDMISQGCSTINQFALFAVLEELDDIMYSYDKDVD